jgi:hypothetical protein
MLKAGAFWLVALIVAGWIIGSSDAFQSCIHQHKNDDAYRALHESSSVVRRTIKRSQLKIVCAGAATERTSGALTVLATALIAWFTFTLKLA